MTPPPKKPWRWVSPSPQSPWSPRRGLTVPQGRPGQYPEITVGGRVYSRINPKVSPMAERAGILLREALVRVGASIPGMTGSPPRRFFKEAVLDRRTAPFTESDLTPEEREKLARVVARARRAGRSYITGADNKADRSEPNWGDVDAPFASALGRANYKLTPEGGAEIDDSYDFNNYEVVGGGGSAESPDGLAWLGRRALPSGIRGVPIKIQLTREQLQQAGYPYGLLPPVQVTGKRGDTE